MDGSDNRTERVRLGRVKERMIRIRRGRGEMVGDVDKILFVVVGIGNLEGFRNAGIKMRVEIVENERLKRGGGGIRAVWVVFQVFVGRPAQAKAPSGHCLWLLLH